MTCEQCGTELVVGMYPFCRGIASNHVPSRPCVIGDEIDVWQENFGHQPEHFRSRQAMARRADQLGLQPFIRNAGPHDKHVPRWSSVDLEAATALVSRQSASTRDDEPVCETARFEVTDVS